MKRLVIYHAQCIDGFTAAWVAHKLFGADATCLPAKYGDAPPDVNGCAVYILDFSYPRDELERMREEARALIVLDHHKTAQEDLEGFSDAVFDMDRSGAGLAWDVLHGSPRPALVSYVEDRDLWRFALPQSKEINAWIGSLTQSFDEWTLAAWMLDNDRAGCVAEGRALLRSVDRYVGEMAKQARVFLIGGESVPVVNAPYINTSELVGHMAESATFAVGWYQRADGRYVYSLRSRGGFDVSEFAKNYGGGGHKNAAGFNSVNPPEDLWAMP